MKTGELETLMRIAEKLTTRWKPEAWEMETSFRLLPNLLTYIAKLKLEISEQKEEINAQKLKTELLMTRVKIDNIPDSQIILDLPKGLIKYKNKPSNGAR
jgi:hypothetical protein